MNIQWYPGHMAKTKRLLQEQLQKADFIIELADARIPHASRNPDLIKLCESKKRVLVLTKSDLAEDAQTKAWLKSLEQNGETVISFDASPKNQKKMMNFLSEASESFVQKARARGFLKTVRAMVIGVPNVGKSTFINRMYGSAITSVANTPGHTKSNRWVKINDFFELMDSPGMLWPRFDDPEAAKHLAYIGTIKDAVYNADELAMELLWELFERAPQAVSERFKLKDTHFDTKIDLLYAVCQGRGFVMRGGEYDWERACSVVLEEFRSGKIGKLTLESVASYAK